MSYLGFHARNYGISEVNVSERKKDSACLF